MPDLVVLHYTGMETAEAALKRLCDPAAEVSAHYLICERGRVWQLVDERLRAWHAGAGAWGTVTDVNSCSIGVELANDGATSFPDLQMETLEGILAEVKDRWKIPPDRVIGHSDCAPGRKIDPGPLFDWNRLVRAGSAVSVLPDEVTEDTFVADMRAAGYTATDDPWILLGALRLRHRQNASGPRDATDRGLARSLARRFPVDAGGRAS